MNEAMDLFSMNQMLEIMELGQAQALAESVALLSKSVQRWCSKNGPRDDVTILGLEIA